MLEQSRQHGVNARDLHKQAQRQSSNNISTCELEVAGVTKQVYEQEGTVD
jgi:hypothetical protein